MRLVRLRLPPPLPRYIHQMWVFESGAGLPPGDLRTIVPNGRTRLILPLQGRLTAGWGGRSWTLGPGQAGIVGQCDRPAVLTAPAEPLVVIGVEFLPAGLAALCPMPMAEIADNLHPLDELAALPGRDLMSRVVSAPLPMEAACLLRDGLAAALAARADAPETLAEATFRLMRGASFAADMTELERRTGYSRRYLSAVFQREVGLSPARLQTILGFEALYRDFARHGLSRPMVDAALDRFHDQAHFSRVFKGLAGLPPGRFAAASNRFGRLFYVD